MEVVGEPPACPACGVRVHGPEDWYFGDEEEVRVRCVACRTTFILRRSLCVRYEVRVE